MAVDFTSLAEAFALGTPNSPAEFVARGAMGEVFRLDTDTSSFAVKRLFAGPTGGEESNARFQESAALHGVPLPSLLRTKDGDLVAFVGGNWWRAYTWVAGASVKPGLPVDNDIASNVAGALGRLHAIGYEPGAPVDDWFLGVSEEDVSSALDVAESAGIDVTGARRGLVALAAISRLKPAAASVGCHNDPDRGNVLVDSDGSIVLIDWDNAGAGFAECEFARALWSWAFDGGDVRERNAIPVMVTAYRAAGGVFAPTDLSVFATMASTWVNYSVQCCRHVADPGVTPETLAFERAAIEHLATYPVVDDLLEQILEMVPA